MGQAIPTQQPAVILRSHLIKLRALLVFALIAVAGLTVAVVILAIDSDELAVGTRGPLPAGLPKTGFDDATRGPLPAGLPKTGFDDATRGPLPAGLPKTGFDDATRGPLPAGLPKTSFDEGARGIRLSSAASGVASPQASETPGTAAAQNQVEIGRSITDPAEYLAFVESLADYDHARDYGDKR
jgi:hypothetical protein